MVKFNFAIIAPLFAIKALGLKAPVVKAQVAPVAPADAQRLYNYFRLADGRTVSKKPASGILAVLKAINIEVARAMSPASR